MAKFAISQMLGALGGGVIPRGGHRSPGEKREGFGKWGRISEDLNRPLWDVGSS